MYQVFIVDDENVIVTGLSKLLPWGKYRCSVAGTANDGADALRRIRQVRPDILFTDIRMPGMDGLALIAALRSEFPEMQVTILSGYSDFKYAQTAIRLGVHSYVLKPSKMGELEEALAGMTAALGRSPAAGKRDACAAQNGEAELSDCAGSFVVNNARRYIEEHYAEKLSLSEVAEQVFVSQWHLSKLIARVTGQSFSDILNGIRVAAAKQLLADPSLKIFEISERVGFSDVSHFSRVFKKHEAQSANEYRNKLPPGRSKPPDGAAE